MESNDILIKDDLIPLKDFLDPEMSNQAAQASKRSNTASGPIIPLRNKTLND
jgi:hypothetical protein